MQIARLPTILLTNQLIQNMQSWMGAMQIISVENGKHHMASRFIIIALFIIHYIIVPCGECGIRAI